MGRNSTIPQKTGICPMCSDNKGKSLTKGLCHTHYWWQVRMKSVSKMEEKDVMRDEDLATLVGDLDIIFSRYIRLKYADLYGRVKCISCGEKQKWTLMDNGHYIPRSHMYTRFSEFNCFPQCPDCNRRKGGNLAEYAKALETLKPGLVEMLQEHSRIVYKYSKQELRSMISEYTHKLKQLK